MEISKAFRFEAAHRLPNVPAEHQCGRLHGHSYEVEVHVSGPVDPHTGWVMDFAELSDHVRPFIEFLDHRYLNEIRGLENPTAENLAVWLWDRIVVRVKAYALRVTVRETRSTSATYRGHSKE